MADAQSYKKHTRWLPPFHFFVLPVLMLYVLNEIRHVYSAPNRSTVFALVVAMAIMATAVLARLQALAAQDRLIRLEMKLRLAVLLPADLMARFTELTVSQLVGLRFASDAELPDLIRTVLKDGTKQADIKKAIKQWVPDTQRV